MKNEIADPKPTFKNCTTGLVIFGVVTILLGVLCALFIPLALWSVSLTTHARGVSAADARPMISGCFTYGLLAIAMVWMGIGSILCRRWARALLLIYSWFWLCIGVAIIGFLIFLLPQLPHAPGTKETILIAVILGIVGFLFVLLPLIGVLFYGHRSVKATCEARNSATSWTDACPLPVLAMSAALVVGAPMLLNTGILYHGTIPFFGWVLGGWAGGIIYFVLAILELYIAWMLYRLRSLGWWLALLLVAGLGISNFVTYTSLDFVELYRRLGMTSSQLEALKQYRWMNGTLMAWFSLGYCAILAGYILCTRHFFKTQAAN